MCGGSRPGSKLAAWPAGDVGTDSDVGDEYMAAEEAEDAAAAAAAAAAATTAGRKANGWNANGTGIAVGMPDMARG